MKATQINEYGENVVKLVELETPIVGDEQILVEVYAAGVNPFDYKVEGGDYKDYFPLSFPVTLGGDFAGKVTQVGNSIKDFNVGDEVYGQANATSQGSFAEYTVVTADKLAKKPKSLDFVASAALPLVTVSAYQAVHDLIKLTAGQKLLIQGGAGGIGAAAIQIAKQVGANVVVTAKAKDSEYVKSLGADEVIDYENEDFSTRNKEFDAVFDTVGGETTVKSLKVIKPNGILVSMIGQVDEASAKAAQVTFLYQSSEVNSERLNKISQLVDDGKLKVDVAKVFSLDDTELALKSVKNDHPRTKVVIKIK